MITPAKILSFVSQIKNANLFKKFLVSYDVTSLFTNIPLQETIDIAINLIFNHNPNLNITRKELKKLLLFATSQTHFIFNSKIYNQIDEVAMGFPLAPVLANIFMGFQESKRLNEYNLNKPKFYPRYIDDLLAAFGIEQDSLNLLKLVSAIFYQIFIFEPNDSPLKTLKIFFYFMKKALFVVETFKFL